MNKRCIGKKVYKTNLWTNNRLSIPIIVEDITGTLCNKLFDISKVEIGASQDCHPSAVMN